ncbi:MAG TPA: HupE/UreJ family protein, partial [Tepidisphaeraceae bacterium]
TRERSVEFGCDWSTDKGRRDARNPVATRVRFWPAALAYFVHGVGHIIGPIDGGRWDWREAGLDHLLFAAALVLGLRRLSDLLLVITAFTLAHTTTLTLSILNLVHVSPRIVEPMIAASIVCTAMQNVFWPEVEGGGHRRIWLRLAPAFAFGLFHGLGFAGGLRDAMSQMPASALGAALGGFTVGVEAGHQVVVLPLFGALYALRHYRAPRPRTALSEAVLRYGSCAITAGGFYFLIQAIR